MGVVYYVTDCEMRRGLKGNIPGKINKIDTRTVKINWDNFSNKPSLTCRIVYKKKKRSATM